MKQMKSPLHQWRPWGAICLVLIGCSAEPPDSSPSSILTASGRGEVQTPTFYRYELGFSSPRRLHEMSSDDEGNLWFSPLDGRLIRYQTATGEVEIIDLNELSGEVWRGRHLWPVPYGREIYLQTPALDDLWVYERDAGKLRRDALPEAGLVLRTGFRVGSSLYLGGDAGVLKWDPVARTGVYIPCPYPLTGESMELTLADPDRQEIWASTAFGNDLLRFDMAKDEWAGHWQAPDADSMPTAALAVFGETLYLKDHLKGRILAFDLAAETWRKEIPIPGYMEWFGWVGGGVEAGGLLYFSHSTLVGKDGSIDGKPHHFIGSWTVFDPQTERFSRLDVPARPGEEFVSSKGIAVDGVLYITAINANEPHNAIILRSRPLPN